MKYHTVHGPSSGLSAEVRYLIECWQNVVGKLDFCYGRGTCCGHADGEACDSLLAERRVEDPRFTVFFLQADCAAEHSTERDILSKSN